MFVNIEFGSPFDLKLLCTASLEACVTSDDTNNKMGFESAATADEVINLKLISEDDEI